MKSVSLLTNKVMLDANLCIRVLRNRPQSIAARFQQEAQSLSLSTIVLHELRYGADRSARPAFHHEQVDGFVAQLTVYDFDANAAHHAADIKAKLAANGQIIGPNDLLIAGHARSLGYKLITGNLSEFRRVEGLLCEDWL